MKIMTADHVASGRIGLVAKTSSRHAELRKTEATLRLRRFFHASTPTNPQTQRRVPPQCLKHEHD